jgi:UDPglucose 6-dehydrogenase
MLAQRISSINSITELCEIHGGSIQDLSKIVGSDKRIGPQFLQSSLGFGGSCFEKDILSFIYILESQGLKEPAEYWTAVLRINNYQKRRLAEKIA